MYLIDICFILLYNWVMITMEQDTLKRTRDNVFTHIQSPPIRYSDTHPCGGVISCYTNDTDTLHQTISQSFLQMFSSIISVTTASLSMLYLSVGLTASVAVFAVLLLKIIKALVGCNGTFFVRQQQALDDVNGYIEEVINGRKVIKVFCHEDRTGEDFDLRSNGLHYYTAEANKYGSITVPVVGGMGCMLYVLSAMVDGTVGIADLLNLNLAEVNVLTIGIIVSFLTLSHNLINPIDQISMQFNIVIMTPAGASHIFKLTDEGSGQDDRRVTPINVRVIDGVVTGCSERTEMWIWKCPYSDGSITHTPLNGNIRFYDVDSEYEEGESVLHNITLYMGPGQRVAFVGATDAGKTTVTNLISHFYDVTGKRI